MRRKVIDASPFVGIANGSQRNPDRQRFIDAATIAKCIDASPDAEWRLLIALARYGGLRVPSEPMALRWADVDWAASTMTVRSPKTERHSGGASRVVPIFPERATPPKLRKFLRTRGRLRRFLHSSWRHLLATVGSKPAIWG